MSFDEWNLFKCLYDFQVSTFDQGKFGHERPKPTAFASNSWMLHEALHNRFLTQEERQCFPSGPSEPSQRIQASQGWACWAPGLTRIVFQAWTQWKAEQSAQEEVQQRKALLKALTAEERHRRHLDNDHIPYQKGCPICIAAQGRQRSHRRQAVTGVFGASFDIAGPFISGQGFDAVASGRDSGCGYKYFLACAYSIPISLNDGSSSPVKDSQKFQGRVPPHVSGDVLEEADLGHEAGGEPGELELCDDDSLYSPDDPLASLTKVTHRYRTKGPETPDSAEPELVQTKTMFLGVPLRTKKASEVMPAVQSIICRLETSGYPVNRYFADRAQELRSSALVAWLRSYGVSASWTAGEDPASNKAELAVQYLKGTTRKLLLASGLPASLWPLAVLHAGRRSWINVSQAFGLYQPSLLPFGQPVQAKRRYKIGAGTAWQDRTIKGIYVGQAPDTAGGHLVLLREEDKYKVLLTNTIFPVTRPNPADTPPKPKYRLKGKSSPHFEVRTIGVSALALVSPNVHLEPAAVAAGGEWEDDMGLASEFGFRSNFDSGFQPGVEAFGWGEGDSVLGEDEQFPHKEGAESSISGQAGRDLKNFQSSSRAVATGPSEVSGLGVKLDKSEFLETCLKNEIFDFATCLQVLQCCVEGFPSPRRRFIEGDMTYAVLGYYCHGGLRGVTKFAQENASLVMYLNRFVAHHNPNGCWTTLYLSKNTSRPMHKGGRNSRDGRAWVIGLGDFQGGGLWVEQVEPPGPVIRQLPDGSFRSGRVLDIHNIPQVFNSLGWHETESGIGQERWVLVAYSPLDYDKMGLDNERLLQALGFPLPDNGILDSHASEARISSCLDSNLVSVAGVGQGMGESNQEIHCLLEQWTLDFPHEVLEEGTHESLVALHAQEAEFRRTLGQELSSSALQGQAGSLGVHFHRAWLRSCWYEELLGRVQPAMEMVASVRALTREVPLNPSNEAPDEIFLQTRTIGLDEARLELPLWVPAGQEEIQSLEVTTGAVVRIKADLVDRWIAEGKSVKQLPGKAVLTRKSGTGRRRLRAVCCGNYLQAQDIGMDKNSLYAGGIDALSVRIVLSFISARPGWHACILDVKSAFLYAPTLGADGKTDDAFTIVVRPPYFLVQLGLLQANDRWQVVKALYGLQSSPKAWSLYRDRELRALVITLRGCSMRLYQARSEDSLWFLKDAEGQLWAILVVYVDDLGVFGCTDAISAVVEAIRAKWNTSTPTWSTQEAVLTFCGIELQQLKIGWRLTQRSYILELLQRYEVSTTQTTPIVRWEELDPEEADPEAVKRAQGIVGAILWAMTRSRPDLMFIVGRLAQWATKAPCRVYKLGLGVLAYLNHTIDYGIHFLYDIGPQFGNHGHLSLPRSERIIEVYSDASHAPQGSRSIQCTIIAWRGTSILWESTRQGFTTLSSAEAELVAMVSSIQAAECVQPVVDELLQDDSTIVLLGDNSASVRSFEDGAGSWRSRHLRRRASAARERVQCGNLTVQHLGGEHQIADLGTKALGGGRIISLLALANVFGKILGGKEEPFGSAARALRRILAIQQGFPGVCPPATILVLSALALAQPVSAQPLEPPWGFDWVLVCLSLLGLLLFGLGVWFRSLDNAFRLFMEVFHGEMGRVEGWNQVSDQDTQPMVVPTLEPTSREADDSHGDPSDVDFLRIREEFTGLTLVQRARLRRQLQQGGVVDPPVMRMRYGGLPPWLNVRDSETPDTNIQVGGSTSSQDPALPELLSGRTDEFASSMSNRQSTPNVQIGGSSSSSSQPPVAIASTMSVHVQPGDFDSGSPESFSRMISATGGRRIVWRVRDELNNVLRRIMTVCGDALVAYLGDRAHELYMIAFVARTFEYGVQSSLRMFWTSGGGRSLSWEAATAYVQGPSSLGHQESEDWHDDPSVDEVPHTFPEEALQYPNPPQPFDLMMYLYHDDSSNSDPVEFESSSEDSIDPSEPEHEPAVRGGQLSEEFEVPSVRAPSVQDRTLYGAEEGYLLVYYLDDVLRVPLPGWSQNAIQAVIQGMYGQGGWSPSWVDFFTVLEGNGVPQEQGMLANVGSAISIPQGQPLAIEDVAFVSGPQSEVTQVSGLSQSSLLLAVGGFCLGMSLSSGFFSLALSFGIVEFSSASWIVLIWHGLILYRAVRFMAVILWGGLSDLPGALGFTVESTSGMRSHARRGPSGIFLVWLILILVFGLATPGDAASFESSDPLRDSMLDQYGLVLQSQAVCNAPTPGYSGKGYGVWWLVPLGCIILVLVWEGNL